MQTVGHCKSVLLEHTQYIHSVARPSSTPQLDTVTDERQHVRKGLSATFLKLILPNEFALLKEGAFPPSSTGRCRLASHSGICNTVSTPAHLLLGPHVA